jgi:hypothetical protein
MFLSWLHQFLCFLGWHRFIYSDNMVYGKSFEDSNPTITYSVRTYSVRTCVFCGRKWHLESFISIGAGEQWRETQAE